MSSNYSHPAPFNGMAESDLPQSPQTINIPTHLLPQAMLDHNNRYHQPPSNVTNGEKFYDSHSLPHKDQFHQDSHHNDRTHPSWNQASYSSGILDPGSPRVRQRSQESFVQGTNRDNKMDVTMNGPTQDGGGGNFADFHRKTSQQEEYPVGDQRTPYNNQQSYKAERPFEQLQYQNSLYSRQAPQQGSYPQQRFQQPPSQQKVPPSYQQQSFQHQDSSPLTFQTVQHNPSVPQVPQSRRAARRPPPTNLPPIQTNRILSEGRRIVSSPTVSHSPTAYVNNSPISGPSVNLMKPTDNRTQSLTNNTKYQYNQVNKIILEQQPQQQDTQPNHRPRSSGNGSSSSIHHTFSLSSRSRSFTSLGKLSSLSTKKFNSSASLQSSKLDRNPSSATLNSLKTAVAQLPKKPVVYPALLSRVARVFKESIILTINTKDGLEYHDTFTGKMAVDVICKIIRTSDRNLALLLGRSLDAQKFFRDVTYNHRLRDSVHEVYAFNHIYSDVEFYNDDSGNNSANNSRHGSYNDNSQFQQMLQQNILSQQLLQQQLPAHSSSGLPVTTADPSDAINSPSSLNLQGKSSNTPSSTGVNGVFTILTDCYSPTCTRNRLCYSIACPRRLEQQARLNLKPQGGLKRAVSRLSLQDKEENKTLWHETVPQSVLEKLDKHEKMRQELIYELIYTERDYVKDLEFMTDFYIMPLRNPANNIIPEREREAFIRTVFGGVNDLLRLAKNLSDSLTRRQQQQKPVISAIADIFLENVGKFEPFIKYSGNKVFASFEHERQQQVNMKYARFLDAIEKKPESRKQDLSSFLIKGIQRPARYQLLLGGIIKNSKPESPDYDDLIKAKEEIEKVLNKINIQTGESTDRHKVMVLHRLLGKQVLEEKYNFKLSYSNRIVYQVTLHRKRDNEKIDLYLFEHALLLVKHKIQNKREQYKVFERPIYLPLLFVNSGFDIPTVRSLLPHRLDGLIISDTSLRNKVESSNYMNNSSTKFQMNFLGLGRNQVHASLFADDLTNQSQVLQQISTQQKKLVEEGDVFSSSRYETRRFHGNNKINCAVPCYGGKKHLYGTDLGVWVSTVRSVSATSSEKICSDPTMVISKVYVTQIEVLVEYSKLLVLSEKSLYEFDLSCTDSLDHAKNTRSGRLVLSHVAFFKVGICDGRLLVCAAKTGNTHSINIFEPSNPFDKMKNKNKRYDIREISFSSDPVSISFMKLKLCVGCTKGFEILSLEEGKKEPILDEADPSLDFATQRELVHPLSIHRLGKNFLLSYSEFSFLIKGNGWRTQHDWGIYWQGNPQNIALFYPYLLAFEPGFIEIRDLDSTKLLRALIGENIRFLHSNEHEALYACEENGYDIVVSIDFLNLKPKPRAT
ncbi:uncharacterized protein PRCAT00001050001 [Priceomyces carsonii]|uniref:uncharacterized protein n=1 Tax=Priceomyces carsonii TaxID=28549 RepID=UPI002ED9E096|nr:unnamed protein product [Priceomyces carsonii]